MEHQASRRYRVLMSAFACEPYKGSEPEVGWQWAVQMARFHDVTVLTQSKNRAGIERAVAELARRQPVPQFVYFDRGTHLQQLRRRRAGLQFYCLLWHKAARDLVSEMHEERPFDLMHHVTIAGFRYPTAIWGHGVPSVWGPIGGIESSPLQLLPWRHLPAMLPELARNIHNKIQHWPWSILPQRLDATTVPLACTLEMQRMFEKMGHPSRVMPTIGLRTADMPIRERSARAGPLKLLFVGNLIALKGVHLAIDAVAASGTDATLTLIGTGDMQGAMKRQVEKLGLGGRVTFRGRLPLQEVLNSYAEFDAFIFPSFHDTGGYAVIEAMCNVLPVICLDCGGPAIAVRAGSGFRVPVSSRATVVAGFAEAIQRYNRDRALLLEHGRNARQTVLENYDWDRKGEQLAVVYDEAVRNWDPKSGKKRFTGAGRLVNTLHHLVSMRGLAATVMIMCAIGLLSISSVSLLKRQARQLVQDTVPGLSYAGKADFNLSQSFNRMLLMLLARTPEERARYQVEMHRLSEKTNRALEDYEDAIYEPGDRRLFGELMRRRDDFVRVRQKLESLLDENRLEEASIFCRQEVLPVYDSYKQAGEVLLNYNVQVGEQRGKSIITMSTMTQLLVAALGVVLFITGFMVGFLK